MDRSIDISIVVPLLDEEKNVGLLHSSIKKVMDKLGREYEMLFIDDGSTDRTFQTLSKINARDKRLKVIRLRRNFGQTAAVSAGFDHARGDVIITMDGDLQNDPADIPKLLGRMDEGYDVVSGWRIKRKDKTISRKIPSKIANWLIGVVTGVKLHDYGCSLKAYRAPVVKNMHLYSDMHRFIPALVTMTGAKITEIVVKHHPRKYGKSKYGIMRTGKVLLDLITVKLLTQFSSRPSHWFGILGALSLFLGLVFGLLSINFYLQPSGEYFPIVIPSLCFLFVFLSFYLLLLGLISELVLKTSGFRVGEISKATAVEIF